MCAKSHISHIVVNFLQCAAKTFSLKFFAARNFCMKFHAFLQGVSVAASPVLATIGMSVRPSVCPSVRHTLALSENDASKSIMTVQA